MKTAIVLYILLTFAFPLHAAPENPFWDYGAYLPGNQTTCESTCYQFVRGLGHVDGYWITAKNGVIHRTEFSVNGIIQYDLEWTLGEPNFVQQFTAMTYLSWGHTAAWIDSDGYVTSVTFFGAWR